MGFASVLRSASQVLVSFSSVKNANPWLEQPSVCFVFQHKHREAVASIRADSLNCILSQSALLDTSTQCSHISSCSTSFYSSEHSCCDTCLTRISTSRFENRSETHRSSKPVCLLAVALPIQRRTTLASDQFWRGQLTCFDTHASSLWSLRLVHCRTSSESLLTP